MNKKGKRSSAASAFIDPQKNNPNLKISDKAIQTPEREYETGLVGVEKDKADRAVADFLRFFKTLDMINKKQHAGEKKRYVDFFGMNKYKSLLQMRRNQRYADFKKMTPSLIKYYTGLKEK